MGQYTDWFIADDNEAAALASIGSDSTSAASFDHWPHLGLKGIIAIDVDALRDILLGEGSKGSELLYEEGEEVFVCRVAPELIQALASTNASAIATLASEWGKTEGLGDWDEADVRVALKQLVEFARRARQEGNSVLEIFAL